MSKKVHVVLDTFNTYLERLGTKYATGGKIDNIHNNFLKKILFLFVVHIDNLTIADLQFIGGTMCLEAIAFDFSSYSHLTKWYNTFKRDNPELWKIADEAKEILIMVAKERPDLSTLYPHPVHPIRLTKA